MTGTLTPTSETQFAAANAGTRPDPEEVARDVWAIAAPIPMGQITHTLSYVLRDRSGAIHIVDPGWDSDENLATMAASLNQLGFRLGDIASTISTHHHPDHLGIAERLRAEFGARIVLSAVEVAVLAHETTAAESLRSTYPAVLSHWGVPRDRWAELEASFDRPVLTKPVDPDVAIDHGEILDIPGHRLSVVSTPGHSGGHACLADTERRVLYSGDHVLPVIYSGVGIGFLPGTDPLADYYASLERLAEFDSFEVLPGHEFRFTGLGHRRRAIADHHLRRTNEIRKLTETLENASVWDYASAMTWTGGFESLSGFSLHSAMRQTEMHLGLVSSEGRA